MDAQAEGRAHRMGQESTVCVYQLVTQGSVEERILELAARWVRRWLRSAAFASHCGPLAASAPSPLLLPCGSLPLSKTQEAQA